MKDSFKRAFNAFALGLAVVAALPYGIVVSTLISTTVYADAADTAAKLVEALEIDARYTERLDGLIVQTAKLPRIWSGTANADTVKLRQAMACETIMNAKPKVIEALKQKLAATYSEAELQNYLSILSKGSPEAAAAHPIAYGVDFAFSDVIMNALFMTAAEINERAENQ